MHISASDQQELTSSHDDQSLWFVYKPLVPKQPRPSPSPAQIALPPHSSLIPRTLRAPPHPTGDERTATDRLYGHGEMSREQLEQYRESLKAIEHEEFNKQNTFKPKTNTARKPAQPRYMDIKTDGKGKTNLQRGRSSSAPPGRAHQTAAISKESGEQTISDREARELTFKPKTNNLKRSVTVTAYAVVRGPALLPHPWHTPTPTPTSTSTLSSAPPLPCFQGYGRRTRVRARERLRSPLPRAHAI